jgi:pimeloyl-ACP methyl ester carboxylesterase
MGVMESRFLDIDGPLHVADWGGKGTPLMLVHGLGGSHLNWMTVAPRLARHHRAWAIDLPGYGKSPLEGRRASVEAHRAHLDRAVAELTDEPVVLVGNSMGGLISTMQAALRPQRTAGLVLVAAALPPPLRNRHDPLVLGAFSAYMVPGLGLTAMRRARERFGIDQIVDQAFELVAFDAASLPADVRQAHRHLYEERANSPDGDRAFLASARSIAGVYMRRRRMRRLIASITAPTLMVHGNRDRLVSVRASMQVAASRPDWELRRFARTGHVPMLEQPDRFCDVVEDWLRRQGLEQPAETAAPAAASSAS